MGGIKVLQGNCLVRLRELPDNSVDSIVTDPPYELGFMGKAWDKSGIANDVKMWAECLRVLRPGGHLLSFGGSRTYHRMACAIEDAGFEIRDQIMWLYGSGFPKSLDVSKAIDKVAGAERAIVGDNPRAKQQTGQKSTVALAGDRNQNLYLTAPATDAARQWDGWGTALKPAHEPICAARKPIEGTVAANVLKHGTGALNVDGCRVGTEERTYSGSGAQPSKLENHGKGDSGVGLMDGSGRDLQFTVTGRWPANVIHDGSDEVLSCFPDSKGQRGDLIGHTKDRELPNGCFGKMAPALDHPARNDSGSAARFFYTAKTSKAERELGCEDLTLVPLAYSCQAQAEVKRGNVEHAGNSGINTVKMRGNNHPTVKPLALMRYLCRLVTPPGGVILDPFTGSGSTGVAAFKEGFGFIGIELKPEYVVIANARLLAEVLS